VGQSSLPKPNVLLRDYFSREEIASDTIRFHNEREDTQLDGVQDRDLSGVRNKPPRILPPDQVLRDAERSTLEILNTKLLKLLPSYTSRFYKEGERTTKANRVDDAVESLICHWAFFRGKLDSRQQEWIRDLVKSETGFDLSTQGGNLLSLIVSTSAAVQGQ